MTRPSGVRWFRSDDGEMDCDDGEDGSRVAPDSPPASALGGIRPPALAGLCWRCGDLCDVDRSECDLCRGMDATEGRTGIYYAPKGTDE